jgi:hypothetical protein
MKCEKYKKLIYEMITGDISSENKNELITHAEQCADCKRQMKELSLLEEFTQAALYEETDTQQAAQNIIANLPSQEGKMNRPYSLFRQLAVAGSIFLAIGIFLGFNFGKLGAGERTKMAQVPLKVTELEGVVLVRHADCQFWKQLKDDSKIYRGDIFQSTAKSKVVFAFYEESKLELEQNSKLALNEFNNKAEFFLEQGELAADLDSPHQPFVVSTPHGRAEALGTKFTVKVE